MKGRDYLIRKIEILEQQLKDARTELIALRTKSENFDPNRVAAHVLNDAADWVESWEVADMVFFGPFEFRQYVADRLRTGTFYPNAATRALNPYRISSPLINLMRPRVPAPDMSLYQLQGIKFYTYNGEEVTANVSSTRSLGDGSTTPVPGLDTSLSPTGPIIDIYPGRDSKDPISS